MNEREQKLQEMLYKLPRMTREGQQWVPLDEVLKLAHDNAGQAAQDGKHEVVALSSSQVEDIVKKHGTALHWMNWAGVAEELNALRQAVPAKAAPSSSEAAPFAYACPANCGCIWRDNKDGTMSLFGKRSQSCEVCEPSPLSALIPLYLAGAPTAASEQGEGKS